MQEMLLYGFFGDMMRLVLVLQEKIGIGRMS